MFVIYKELIESGKIYQEKVMVVSSEEKAHVAVQQIRKMQGNQLAYYKEM